MKFFTRSTARLTALGRSGAVLTATAARSTSSLPSDDAGPATISSWAWVPGLEDAVALWKIGPPNAQVDFARIASADATSLPSQSDARTARGPSAAGVTL